MRGKGKLIHSLSVGVRSLSLFLLFLFHLLYSPSLALNDALLLVELFLNGTKWLLQEGGKKSGREGATNGCLANKATDHYST